MWAAHVTSSRKGQVRLPFPRDQPSSSVLLSAISPLPPGLRLCAGAQPWGSHLALSVGSGLPNL